MLSTSSGFRSNVSWNMWNFTTEDKNKYLQYTFPGLARIAKLELQSKVERVEYINRNNGKWETATLSGNNFVGSDSKPETIVTSAIKMFLPSEDDSVDLYNFGVIGCLLGSQGIDIQEADIPEKIKWKINLEDLQPTTDPIFVMAKKSSIPKGNTYVHDDTHKRELEVVIPLLSSIETCNIDNDTLSKVMSVILDNPVAVFTNFDGSLKSEDGDIRLTLKFQMVSYSEAQADVLKAEALRRLPKNGNLMPCYGAQAQGYSANGNTG